MSKTVWTAEMLATACGMKRAGIKMQTIADRLGVTRASVIGATNRAGSFSDLQRRSNVIVKKKSRMSAVFAKMQDMTDD